MPVPACSGARSLCSMAPAPGADSVGNGELGSDREDSDLLTDAYAEVSPHCSTCTGGPHAGLCPPATALRPSHRPRHTGRPRRHCRDRGLHRRGGCPAGERGHEPVLGAKQRLPGPEHPRVRRRLLRLRHPELRRDRARRSIFRRRRLSTASTGHRGAVRPSCLMWGRGPSPGTRGHRASSATTPTTTSSCTTRRRKPKPATSASASSHRSSPRAPTRTPNPSRAKGARTARATAIRPSTVRKTSAAASTPSLHHSPTGASSLIWKSDGNHPNRQGAPPLVAPLGPGSWPEQQHPRR